MAKQKQPVFERLIGISIIAVLFGAFLIYRGNKDKSEFDKITGTVLSATLTGEHRNIFIEGYPGSFNFFAGEGTFAAPALDRTGELSKGDVITIYYDRKVHRGKPELQTQFIDKGNEHYFMRGSKDKKGGISFIAFGIVFAGVLYFLKLKGKII